MGFIEDIAKYVKKYAPSYGIKVYSPIIAQAILESTHGTSELAVNANNYFGLKYNPEHPKRCPSACGYYVKIGSEQRTDGTYRSDIMLWQKFNTLEDGVKGYFDFLNYSSRYNNLKGILDPKKYLETLKGDGYATSLNYVVNVMATLNNYNLTQYDNSAAAPNTISGTISSLVDCTKLSPNHSGKRTHKVDRITPHCVVGQLSAEAIGNCFTSPSKQASCNYGIGKDGKVVLVVDETNRSWCSSSAANDQRAITIECASDKTNPYAMTNEVYNKLIELSVDICKRYGKTKLLWFNDKTKTLAYEPKEDEMVLTVHRWFKNKACPGDWLYSRLGNVAAAVTQRLQSGEKIENTKPQVTEQPPQNKGLYRVQVGAYSLKKNAEALQSNLAKKGISGAIVVQVNNLYKVQVGAYSKKENAEAMLSKLQKVGFNGFISEPSNTNAASAKCPYIVQVTASKLNVRKGPSTKDASNGYLTPGRYTIVEEKNNFGKLKSGAGWISLDYAKKI